MERRHSQRVPVSLEAQIISDGKVYSGVIDNISEDGMEYLVTSFIKADKDFTSEKRVEMNFRAPSGEAVNLHCEVKWRKESAIDDRVLIVGMKIINPSPDYRKLIKDIYINNSDDEHI
jgi:hypothetical protein